MAALRPLDSKPVCLISTSASTSVEAYDKLYHFFKEVLEIIATPFLGKSEAWRHARLLCKVKANWVQQEQQSSFPPLRKIAKQIEELAQFLDLLCNRSLSTRSPIVTVNIAFYCDLNGQDYNGAILEDFIDSLKYPHVVIITSCSLIQGAHLDSHAALKSKSFQALISASHHTFYLHRKGELIVALPKATSLEKQGFSAEHFTQIQGVSQIFEAELKSPILEDFFDLFEISNPLLVRQVLLSGHGDEYSIGALEIGLFQRLLHFFDQLKIKRLIIDSCCGGGHLLNCLSMDQQGVKRLPSYAILMMSIGDLSTADGCNPGIFEYLESAQNTRGSLRAMQNMYDAQKWGENKKPLTNFVQVYLPNTGEFRPLAEGMRAQSITEKKIAANKEGCIKIYAQDMLEIFPKYIDLPIYQKGSMPVLVSMLPGRALHWFKEMHLSGHLITFFKSCAIHSEDLPHEKVFFIEKCVDESGDRGLVALYFDDQTFVCYSEKPSPCRWFYTLNSRKPRKKLLSFTSFIFQLYQIVHKTHLPSDHFGDFFAKLCPALKFYVEHCSVSLTEEVKGELLRNFNSVLQCFWEQAVLSNHTALIFFLLNQTRHRIEINTKSPWRTPYTSILIANQQIAAVKLMLQKKVNLFETDARKSSILKEILKLNDVEVIETLLNGYPQLDYSRLEKHKPLYARASLAVIKKLLQKELLKINASTNGSTILKHFVNKNDANAVQELLKMGAEVERGSPSAIIFAIRRHNLNLTEILIPFLKCNLHLREVFFEATEKGNELIFKLILKVITSKASFHSLNYIFAFHYAFKSLNISKINLLIEHCRDRTVNLQDLTLSDEAIQLLMNHPTGITIGRSLRELGMYQIGSSDSAKRFFSLLHN